MGVTSGGFASIAYETLPTPGSSSSATSRWVVSSRLEAAAPPSPGSPGWGPGTRVGGWRAGRLEFSPGLVREGTVGDQGPPKWTCPEIRFHAHLRAPVT